MHIIIPIRDRVHCSAVLLDKEVKTMDGNEPVKVLKAGGVRAAVWENTITRNGTPVTVPSMQIDRTYIDGEEFKHTACFDPRDLRSCSWS